MGTFLQGARSRDRSPGLAAPILPRERPREVTGAAWWVEQERNA